MILHEDATQKKQIARAAEQIDWRKRVNRLFTNVFLHAIWVVPVVVILSYILRPVISGEPLKDYQKTAMLITSIGYSAIFAAGYFLYKLLIRVIRPDLVVDNFRFNERIELEPSNLTAGIIYHFSDRREKADFEVRMFPTSIRVQDDSFRQVLIDGHHEMYKVKNGKERQLVEVRDGTGTIQDYFSPSLISVLRESGNDQFSIEFYY